MSAALPRVGLIGLDTSHSTAWVRQLQSLGHSPVIYDEGPVWRTAEVDAYCRAQNLTRAQSLDELIASSAIIAVLTCDWDRHVALAAPCLAAGRTVYIDKPIAGSHADLEQLRRWSDRPLVLGSGHRYHPSLLAWRNRPVDALQIRSAQRGPFYRAIHAVEISQTVAGPGARRVRWIPHEAGPTFQVEHDRVASWTVGWERPERGFVLTRFHAEQSESLQFRPDATMQENLFAEVLRVQRGEAPRISADEAVEAVRILRAAWTSQRRAGAWVACADPDLIEFSGADFAAQYRATDTPGLA